MTTVTIYSTPTCHFCHEAKDWLDKHNITYTDHDVAADETARNQMIEKSGQMGVPVIIIQKEGEEESIIVGFDTQALQELLDIKD